MKVARLVVASIVGAVAVAACSSADSTPAACTGSTCTDAAVAGDASAAATDAEADTAADVTAVDAHCRFVDDAGVTEGCGSGSMGEGDRDDGGDQDVASPTVAMDAGNLMFGSSCWDNAQCTSNICYDFRAKGQFCTQPCTVDADCPQIGSLGCNGMGLCRVGS